MAKGGASHPTLQWRRGEEKFKKFQECCYLTLLSIMVWPSCPPLRHSFHAQKKWSRRKEAPCQAHTGHPDLLRGRVIPPETPNYVGGLVSPPSPSPFLGLI